MKKLFWIVGILTVLLISCGKQREPPRSATDSTAVDSSQTDSTLLKQVVEQGVPAPAWYVHIPQKEGALYAAARGRSLRPNIARDKAMMRAQKELAAKMETLKQKDSARTKAVGGAQAAEEQNNGTQLTGAIIKEQKQFKKGKYWYVYILMEMPVSAR